MLNNLFQHLHLWCLSLLMAAKTFVKISVGSLPERRSEGVILHQSPIDLFFTVRAPWKWASTELGLRPVREVSCLRPHDCMDRRSLCLHDTEATPVAEPCYANDGWVCLFHVGKLADGHSGSPYYNVFIQNLFSIRGSWLHIWSSMTTPSQQGWKDGSRDPQAHRENGRLGCSNRSKSGRFLTRIGQSMSIINHLFLKRIRKKWSIFHLNSFDV